MSGYKGEQDYRHDAPECLGVLLVNLGSPEAPTTSAVRRYLAEFLWDPRVVEIEHGRFVTRDRRNANAGIDPCAC